MIASLSKVDVIKVVRILCAAVLLSVLAACVGGCTQPSGWVKFKNASFEGGPTKVISGPLAKPDGNGPFPAVVILHTCGGLRPRFIVDWPDYLTGLGYVTLSVDSFRTRGKGRCRRGRRRALIMELTAEAYGALDYLASLPYVDKERIGVMGFSLGGHIIDYFVGQGYKTPSGLDFKAAVSLYGKCHYLFGYASLPPEITNIIPTMVIIGELDIRFLDGCKAIVGRSPYIKVHLLPDTYHSFDAERHATLTDDYFGNPMLYSEKATIKARELTKAYLAEHLGKR